MVKIISRPKHPIPERPVIIQSGDLCLEGLWIRKKEEFLPCIINSPHPQYGGTMDSPYLNELAYILANGEVSSLRFNYRGTGASQGEYSGSEGEQADMRAAMDFLLESVSENSSTLVAAGYSFGSWIAGLVAQKDPRIRRTLLVAPPILKYDFSFLPNIKTSIAILVGDQDEFCPLDQLDLLLKDLSRKFPQWDLPPVFEVPDASHYFVRGLSIAGTVSASYLMHGKFPEEK